MAERAARILIVNKSQTLRTVCKETFEKAGWAVDTCAETDAASALAKKNAPSVVVIDATAKDMANFEHALRSKSAPTRHVPFIFLFDQDAPDDMFTPLESGADTHLSRPLDIAELLARCEALIDLTHHALIDTDYQLVGELLTTPILDVLSIVEARRLTGVLRVRDQHDTYEITYSNGSIHDAKTSRLHRKSAVCELLGLTEGWYEFVPKNEVPFNKVFAKAHALAAEHIRLLDERARLRPLIPDPDEVIGAAESPGHLKPLEAAIATMSDGKRTVREIIADVPLCAPAADVLLGKLVEGGVLIRGATTKGDEAADETWATRLRSRYGLRAEGPQVARVLVLGARKSGVSTFLNTLRDLFGGSKPSARLQSDTFTVPLSKSLTLHVLGCPVEKRFFPLWRDLLTDSIGVVYVASFADPASWEHARFFFDKAGRAFDGPSLVFGTSSDRSEVCDPDFLRSEANVPLGTPVVPIVATDKDFVRDAFAGFLDLLNPG